MPFSAVTPAKAGAQYLVRRGPVGRRRAYWIAAFAGMTGCFGGEFVVPVQLAEDSDERR
jgi:hypothetical protein